MVTELAAQQARVAVWRSAFFPWGSHSKLESLVSLLRRFVVWFSHFCSLAGWDCWPSLGWPRTSGSSSSDRRVTPAGVPVWYQSTLESSACTRFAVPISTVSTLSHRKTSGRAQNTNFEVPVLIRTFILPLRNEVGKVSNSYIDRKKELRPNWMPSRSSYRSKYLQGRGGEMWQLPGKEACPGM